MGPLPSHLCTCLSCPEVVPQPPANPGRVPSAPSPRHRQTHVGCDTQPDTASIATRHVGEDSETMCVTVIHSYDHRGTHVDTASHRTDMGRPPTDRQSHSESHTIPQSQNHSFLTHKHQTK